MAELTEQQKINVCVNLRIAAIRMHLYNDLTSRGVSKAKANKICDLFIEGTITNDINVSPFVDALMKVQP